MTETTIRFFLSTKRIKKKKKKKKKTSLPVAILVDCVHISDGTIEKRSENSSLSEEMADACVELMIVPVQSWLSMSSQEIMERFKSRWQGAVHLFYELLCRVSSV